MNSASCAVVHTGSTRCQRQLRALQRERRPIVLLATPGMTRAAAIAQARSLAPSLGLPLQRVALERVTSTYIGETEKNLNRLLDQAEARTTVLFFDEADALFGKRTEVRDAHDRYASQQVNSFLSRLAKRATVIALAAPGRIEPSRLPPSSVHLVVKAAPAKATTRAAPRRP